MEGGEEYSKFAQMFMEDILKRGIVSDKSIENNNLKENIKEFCNKNKINFVDIRDLEKFEGVDLLPLVYNTLYKFVNNKPSEGYHILNVVNPYTSAKYHFQIYCNREDNIEKKDVQLTMDEIRYTLETSYEDIIEVLKDYTFMDEKHYPKAALWILGTYLHKNFPTYPIMFLNATKGSGKSRTLSLMAYLSYNGLVLNNITEAVLFRSDGTIAIDEFEGITRKGSEVLNELLNSCYKRGSKVRRMKKVRTKDGEAQVMEEFDMYKPVIMANINGIGRVLEDRCIVINLDKTDNPLITKIFELYEGDERIQNVKKNLSELAKLASGVCSVGVHVVYKLWNDYIKNKYTTYTHTYTTLSTLSTQTTYNNIMIDSFKKRLEDLDWFFNKLDESGINGRNLEISMPLLVLSYILNSEIFEENLKIMGEFDKNKRQEDYLENHDNYMIDFVSQYPNKHFATIKSITQEFRDFTQSDEDFINPKWTANCLRRLNLILEKKRTRRGIEVILNIEKAQDKMRMLR